MGDFGMQDVYTLHIKRYRGSNKIVSPNCEACQKGFIHVNTLQVRQFTQSGKLPGVCKTCNTQFLKVCRSQIRNMNHIDQPSHECEMCGKTFTHAGNYLKHKRLHEAADHANLQTLEIIKAKLEGPGIKTGIKEEKNTNKIAQSTEDKYQLVVETKKEKPDIQLPSVQPLGMENDENIENEVESNETRIEDAEIKDTEPENPNITETGTEEVENKGDSEIENLGPGNEEAIDIETVTQDEAIEEDMDKLISKVESTVEKASKPVLVPKSDPPYICTTCNKVFKKYGSYVSHCETHKGPLVCPICEKLCNTRALLKTHFERCESRQPVYMCHYCEKVYNTKSSLKTHLDTHVIAQETHVCKFCKKVFIVAEQLEEHLLEHISNTNIDIDEGSTKKVSESSIKPPPPSDVKLNHYCVECGKGFVHLGKLKSHMTTHNKSVPFECRSCKKLFIQSFRLVKHMKMCYKLQDMPVYPCSICNKTFNYPNSLRRHRMLHRGTNRRMSPS